MSLKITEKGKSPALGILGLNAHPGDVVYVVIPAKDGSMKNDPDDPYRRNFYALILDDKSIFDFDNHEIVLFDYLNGLDAAMTRGLKAELIIKDPPYNSELLLEQRRRKEKIDNMEFTLKDGVCIPKINGVPPTLR